jgi:SAM-dependent methyltransferase
MAHPEQQDFCTQIKNMFPDHFINKDVLDVGSQDINGTNKYLFENCNYIGLDIGPALNVDVVCPIHEYNPEKKFDTIISTEMLEHDKFREMSLKKMVELLKPGGLLIFTAGGYNRTEHGTHQAASFGSPFTLDYYGNIHIDLLTKVFNLEEVFSRVIIDYLTPINDIRFVGIKR